MGELKKKDNFFIGIFTFLLILWWLFSLGVIPSILALDHALSINSQPQFLEAIFSFGVFFYLLPFFHR